MAEQYLTEIETDRVDKVVQENGRVQYIKYVRCKCKCGREVVVRQGAVKTSSCGCKRVAENKRRTLNVSGQKFNRLTAMFLEGGKWFCVCDCGGTALVRVAALKNGNTKSCGCLQKEKASASMNLLLEKYRIDMGYSPEQSISDVNRVLRAKFHTEIRPIILKRDDYRCLLCNTEESLHVHHILGWSEHPGERFNPRNCATVCEECHFKIHNENTKGPMNEELNSMLIQKIAENHCAREPISAGGL